MIANCFAYRPAEGFQVRPRRRNLSPWRFSWIARVIAFASPFCVTWFAGKVRDTLSSASFD
jgi:hypothetical protein